MWRNHDSHRVNAPSIVLKSQEEDLRAPSTINNVNLKKHNSSCSTKMLLRQFISWDPQLLHHHLAPKWLTTNRHPQPCGVRKKASCSKTQKSPRPSNRRTGCKCFQDLQDLRQNLSRLSESPEASSGKFVFANLNYPSGKNVFCTRAKCFFATSRNSHLAL